MAVSAALLEQPFHLRSISLPSRPHPISLGAEEQLRKLRRCVSSSCLQPTCSVSTLEMMCDSLRGLGGLHSQIQDLLHLPSNKQVLFQSPNHIKKLLEEEVDRSIRLLDLCGTVKDTLVALREQGQDLSSALRRRERSATGEKVSAYIRRRKEAQKVVQRCCKEFKCFGQSALPVNGESHQSGIVKMLTEARDITISLLCSVSSFVSMKPKPKSSRWSFVSKALHKRKFSCEEEDSVEMGRIDVTLLSASKEDADGGRLLMVQKQLEAFDISLGRLEDGLECLFRGLIRSRVALLDILSLQIYFL